MIEFIQAGGWLMIPIVLSSVIAMAIVIERGMALQLNKVAPVDDIEQAHKLAQSGRVSAQAIKKLQTTSVLGKVLAVGLQDHNLPRHVLKENIEEAGRHAVHDMARYLPALGTIAVITPLMGLLGTVLGMIQVFGVITEIGVGSPTDLAGGISQALITTATGISVAILSLIAHRYFKAKINSYVITMEKQAVKLLAITSGNNLHQSAVAPLKKPKPNVKPQKSSSGIEAIIRARTGKLS